MEDNPIIDAVRDLDRMCEQLQFEIQREKVLSQGGGDTVARLEGKLEGCREALDLIRPFASVQDDTRE